MSVTISVVLLRGGGEGEGSGSMESIAVERDMLIKINFRH